MSAESGNKTALGIAFLTIGIALAVSFALTLGPAFFGLGLPCMGLGLIFMSRKRADDADEGVRDGI
ncbi:hypothetical protein [Alteriqipengyuania lutimaris]|uniref:Uncharacterized protein n=1 Tax=Alteriqipengyuania lutimaris TaxID=1538146 RepID=A0A395LRG7_9SPHN|nr:hypothetical protein [Alteriqipengyuania lutimaris]MBB3032788.1 1,4-dihydroxy-2-naphthoate octaprenyltransferase [Alteriqipengyuania lutimaris]RDS78114.1 hypothetical protein DL238_11210 [Alteriqipengyuania lutimaris]